MNPQLHKYLANTTHSPQIPLGILLSACVLGVWYISFSSIRESAFALWAWGVAVFLPFYARDISSEVYQQGRCKIAAWALILCTGALAFTRFSELCLPCLLIAGILFFGNFRIASFAGGAILIWTFLLPNAEYLQHLISYPLRLIGAQASALILNLLGYAVSASQTNIIIEGHLIVITAACSGIEQLEAMLLVGWLVALYMQRTPFYFFFHFLTLLPVILFSNTVRLLITLLGTKYFGDVMLSDGVHTTLGYAMVLLVILLFIGVGKLFPQVQKESTK